MSDSFTTGLRQSIGDKGKERSTATIYVATYNVRSLAHSDDLQRLQEQLREIKWNIVGISETKRKGEGLTELEDGTWMYEAAKTKDEKKSQRHGPPRPQRFQRQY